jgi:hypothetical protein
VASVVFRPCHSEGLAMYDRPFGLSPCCSAAYHSETPHPLVLRMTPAAPDLYLSTHSRAEDRFNSERFCYTIQARKPRDMAARAIKFSEMAMVLEGLAETAPNAGHPESAETWLSK